MIRYRIDKNPLVPGTFKVQTLPGGVLKLDQIVRQLAHATALTEVEVKGVLLGLFSMLELELLKGQIVKLDQLGIWSLSIAGALESKDVVLDRENAQLKVNVLIPKQLVKKLRQQAEFVEVVQDAVKPLFKQVTSQTLGNPVNSYQPGHTVLVTGKKLQVRDQTDPEQGVFLKDEDGDETRIDFLIANTVRRLQFRIPEALEGSGNLKLIVRTRYTENGALRSNEYYESLTEIV